MPNAASVIPQLKEALGRGLDQAIKKLEEMLAAHAASYNTFVQIKARYSNYLSGVALGVVSQKDLDLQYAQLSQGLMWVIDSIQDADLKPDSAVQPAAGPRRGELLYQIPRKMQEQREYRCAVRVAYLKEVLANDWDASEDDVQRDIRVAEVMAVELVNVLEDEPFQIRALTDALQFLDENDYTEWVFMVKPKKEGYFPLALKVSVVEVRNGREVKKDVVLEQEIEVAAEMEDAPEAKFKGTGMEIDFGGTAAPEASRGLPGGIEPQPAAKPGHVAPVPVLPSSAQGAQEKSVPVQTSAAPRKNSGMRAVALFLAFIVFGSATTWALTPADTREWVYIRYVKDDAEAYAEFAEKHPESQHTEKALYRKAVKTEAPRDFLVYQEKFPQGRYSRDADVRLKDLEIRQLREVSTATSTENVRQFVQNFPNSEHLPEVLEKVEQRPAIKTEIMAELEDASIKQVRRSPDARKVSTFLRSFPTSDKVQEIQTRLDTMPQLREAVKQDLENARFEQVRQSAEPQAAKQFLQEYPETIHHEEVKKILQEKRQDRKSDRRETLQKRRGG